MIPIAFDLDGTLVHSVPDLHRAASMFLADQGKPALDIDTVQGFVGNGVPKLVERVAEASGLPLTETDLARYVSVFSDHYQCDPVGLSSLFPGVTEALETLLAWGHPLAVCTNKPEAPTRAIIEHFKLDRLFGVVIGGDSLPVRKPDPAPLHAALGDARGLFVGDSEVDAATADAAGIPFLLFTEGYRHAPVSELPHHVAFTSFEDLSKLVERVAGGG